MESVRCGARAPSPALCLDSSSRTHLPKAQIYLCHSSTHKPPMILYCFQLHFKLLHQTFKALIKTPCILFTLNLQRNSSGSGTMLNTWLTVLFNSPIMLLDNYNHFTGEKTERQYRPAQCDSLQTEVLYVAYLSLFLKAALASLDLAPSPGWQQSQVQRFQSSFLTVLKVRPHFLGF